MMSTLFTGLPKSSSFTTASRQHPQDAHDTRVTATSARLFSFLSEDASEETSETPIFNFYELVLLNNEDA